MFFFSQPQTEEKIIIIIKKKCNEIYIYSFSQDESPESFGVSISEYLNIKTFHALVKDTCFGPWYPAVRWSGNIIGFVYSFQQHSFVLM